MSDLMQKLAKLSPEQRELVLKKLEAAGRLPSSAMAEPVIPRVARERDFPLSHSQQRLWFLEQAALQEDAAINIPWGWRLEGPLDRDLLSSALESVIARHEILRTTYPIVDDLPRQRILPPGLVRLMYYDLSAQAEASRLACAEQEVLAWFAKPLDHAGEGPICFLLFRLEEETHLFFTVVRHIAADGWSRGIFHKDLERAYTALASGQIVQWPAEPLQYVDYTNWWHDQLENDPKTADHLAALQRRLGPPPAPLALPFDRIRAAGDRHAVIPFTLDAAMTQKLRTFAAERDASLFMVLLAAWSFLLGRYTREEGVNVGSFSANRDKPELHDAMGVFINTLVLRVDLTERPSFTELTARAREVCLEAFDGQHIPYEMLAGAYGATGGRTPALFDVMLVVQNLPHETPKAWGDLSVSDYALSEHRTFSTAAMSLIVYRTDPQIAGSWEFDSGRFDSETIEAMRDGFVALLQAALDTPDRPVDTLTFGEPTARLVSEPAPQASRDWVAVFLEAASRHADAPAVISSEGTLTYREFTGLAQTLAKQLQSMGVRRGDRVGLGVARGRETYAALVAILMSGAAYVPLDPAYPSERLSYIAADAGISLFIGESAETPSWLAADVPILALDAGNFELSHTAVQQPAWDACDAAYIVYTSGSTGMPKGVVVSRGAMMSYVAHAAADFELGPGDRALQFATLNFDAAVEEIFPTLMTGAALVPRTEAMMGSAGAFLDVSDQFGITVWNFSTAYWHMLVREIEAEQRALPPNLRLTIIGGEKAESSCLDAWRRIAPAHVRLRNTYGPTEASVVAVAVDLAGPKAPAGLEGAPIGRPVGGKIVYLLDDRDQPVPRGAVGRLILGGAGLADGYINGPELTESVFRTGPDGTRCYDTGDLARLRRDGLLAFMGRVDDQVKIRGFRVEPGEVETHLTALDGVAAAVVTPTAPEDGATVGLVAHVVTNAGATATDLRARLQARLPEYMVPGAFLFYDVLPLTAAGKVDRRALAAKQPQEDGGDAEYAPPETDIERTMVAIWEAVLDHRPIGVLDNFFDLGGHSLLGIQIISRVNREFDVSLNLGHLFQEPEPAGLAFLVEDLLLAELEDEEADG